MFKMKSNAKRIEMKNMTTEKITFENEKGILNL